MKHRKHSKCSISEMNHLKKKKKLPKSWDRIMFTDFWTSNVLSFKYSKITGLKLL